MGQWLIALTALVLRAGFGLAQSDDSMVWTHHAILDHEGKVHLYWTPMIQDIIFEVQAQTKGYIGIGFSPDGKMAGSDIAVGWVINKEPTLQDRFALGNYPPELDTHQDYQLLRGYENETHTVLRFQRKYDTCDSQDMKITNDTMKVIFAYHDEDPKSNFPDMHHQMAGYRGLFLAGFNNVGQGQTPNKKTFEMRLPNITLPRTESSFCWNKVFKYTPQSSSTEVVIGYAPLWRNTTAPAVDHIWLYKCEVSSTESITNWDLYSEEKGYACNATEAPADLGNCTQVVATATAGSLGYFLPSRVGYTFSHPTGVSSVYFLMKVAYRQWNTQHDIQDDSGIAIQFGTDAPTFQASTMTIGHAIGMTQVLPLDLKDFVTVGHCDGECTKNKLPAKGIHIYEVFLDARQQGRKMHLRHFRNGTELAPLAIDDKFDDKVQVYRAYLDPVQILPGDNLDLECTYDTTEAKSTLTGGLQPDNEACRAYISYYPVIDLESCVSSPPIHQLFSWLGTQQNIHAEPKTYEETLPNSQNHKDIVDYVKNLNWSTRKPEFQSLVVDKYTAICENAAGNYTVSEPRSPAKIEHPYYEISSCEGKGTIMESNNTQDGHSFTPQQPTSGNTPPHHDIFGNPETSFPPHSPSGHGNDPFSTGPGGHETFPPAPPSGGHDPFNPMMGDESGGGGHMPTDHPNELATDSPSSEATKEGGKGNGAEQHAGSFGILISLTLLSLMVTAKQ